MTSSYPSLDRHIAARLRNRRRAAGLAFAEIAAATGISAESVAAIETGRRPAQAAELWQIAQALGVDANFFFFHVRRPGPAPARPRAGRDVASLRLAQLLARQPLPLRREIVRVVGVIIKAARAMPRPDQEDAA